MKLSRSVSYAVSILLRLAQEGGGPLTAARVSKGCRFPPRYLYRILRRLVGAGLLRGVSGPGGGYVLARPPRAIALLDIVEAVEGPVVAAPPPAVHPKQRVALATVNACHARAQARFREELQKLTLARLAAM